MLTVNIKKQISEAMGRIRVYEAMNKKHHTDRFNQDIDKEIRFIQRLQKTGNKTCITQ